MLKGFLFSVNSVQISFESDKSQKLSANGRTHRRHTGFINKKPSCC